MLIRLDLIKPSPHPIRTSWDEDKMAELAQSIKEQGVIVPIKVRATAEIGECQYHGFDYLDGSSIPLNDSNFETCMWCAEYSDKIFDWTTDEDDPPPFGPVFEIIYGHRRVEAARRAGLWDIPAVLEEVDDTDALVQALIENVQREDMEPIDLARALKALQDITGWSQREMARRGLMPPATISVTMALLQETESVQQLVKGGYVGPRSPHGSISREHVTSAREAGTTVEEREQLLPKAAKESLSRVETRRLAEAYKSAQDDAERQAILETDYHDPAFDRLVRVKSEVKRERARQERKKREEEPREVAQYLKAVQAFSDAIHEAVAVAEYGKFSPEAMRFVKSWHDSVRGLLDKLEQAMEAHNAKVQEQGG